VTGGEFWKPYGEKPNSALFQYRAPLDLDNPRLRMLASALGPAYVRVSGTWANTTYVADTDRPLAPPPTGFTGVLSRAQWKGVVAFAKAVDAEVVTSFAIGAGTRDAAGAWTADQAGRLLDDTRSIGGRIAAAEFMNEPDLAAGAPHGYDAAAYGHDFKTFHAFARQAAPTMLILGPGAAGDAAKTRDLLAASRPVTVDVFSYHYYGALSQRCNRQTDAAAALSEAWLARTGEALALQRRLRDTFAPGKPIWLTETADAACGGNPWAKTFLDTFRYLDQLGRLAKLGVKVVMHNTLVGSDYGLLDEKTFTPRPNYWAALLWRRLMGATVLESGISIQEGLHVYAHCLRRAPGGVVVLVINNDKTAARTLSVPLPGERYTLSSDNLQSPTVQLNGTEFRLGAGDALSNLTAVRTPAGTIQFNPATITFIAFPAAENKACS
jgi:Glycosyl hydrolase family 79, N-terminal domain